MKKIISLFLIIFLLNGCTLFNKEYSCNKEIKDENYDFNITLDMTFNMKKNIMFLDSVAIYKLTDKGKEKIDTFNKMLSEKNKMFDGETYIKVDYEINDDEILVYEYLDFKGDEVFKNKNLSSVYLNEKVSLDDVLDELKKNGFSCKNK